MLDQDQKTTELPLAELKDLLQTRDMPAFCKVCDALCAKGNYTAFSILKEYLNDKDIYKRLYTFKTIFRMPYAKEITDRLEAALLGNEKWFYDNAFGILINQDIGVNEDILKRAVMLHFSEMDHDCRVLEKLPLNDDNYDFIKNCFMIAANSPESTSSKLEIVSEVLYSCYSNNHAEELFNLFSDSDNPKVRQLAVIIGRDYGFDVSRFRDDPNGHVRKAAKSKEEKEYYGV